jgi:hypothetical protein
MLALPLSMSLRDHTGTCCAAGICNSLPLSTTQGYQIICNDNNLGGNLLVCDSNACGNCGTTIPFTNGQCVANPSGTGSLSANVTCAAPGTFTPSLPTNVQAGDFGVAWHTSATCAAAESSTTATGAQDVCHLLPNSQNQGYTVTCNADANGGTYSLCNDATCTGCNAAAPFTNDECITNNAGFGPATVQFHCAVPTGTADTLGNAARITWHNGDNCGSGNGNSQSDPRTVVLLQKSVCQSVPDGPGSYFVNCNAGNGNGTLNFCTDDVCQVCDTITGFANDQCLVNPPNTGSASVSATCDTNSLNNLVPQPGDVLIQWFGPALCQTSTNPALATQTFVLAPAGTCHQIPGPNANSTSTGSYQVTCNAGGTGGVFSVCSTDNCGTCGTNTPFGNGDCLANPASTGSASVRFTCMQAGNNTSGASEIVASKFI